MTPQHNPFRTQYTVQPYAQNSMSLQKAIKRVPLPDAHQA